MAENCVCRKVYKCANKMPLDPLEAQLDMCHKCCLDDSVGGWRKRRNEKTYLKVRVEMIKNRFCFF